MQYSLFLIIKTLFGGYVGFGAKVRLIHDCWYKIHSEETKRIKSNSSVPVMARSGPACTNWYQQKTAGTQLFGSVTRVKHKVSGKFKTTCMHHKFF